jgi:hypothetical protein
MDDTPARQIGGKVAPSGRAPREATHLDARRLGLGLILCSGRGQFLELQFQLIDEPLAARRTRTEHLALHLRDHQLQVLDQRMGTSELGARLDQSRLQRGHVVGKLFGALSHARDTSTIALIRARPESISRSFIHRLSGCNRSPCVLGISPIDSVQHVSELRRRDRNDAVRSRGPNEPAALQPLGVERHADAVMPEDLYQRAALPPKHIEIAGVRIALERLLHLQRQAVHPAPHVGMAGRDPHPNPGRQWDHRATSALTIADANSLGAVAAMRTRMSPPSSISSAGWPAIVRWSGPGATTTSAKPVAAARRSCRQR